MHAAYIEIGEVGAIRFVQVVVAVNEVGAGRYDHGLEERRGTGFGGEARRWKEVVAKRCTQNTYMPCKRQRLEIEEGEDNCQNFPVG